MQTRNYLVTIKKIDWLLLSGVLLLVFFGLAAIYTLNISKDNLQINNFTRQAIFFGVGLILFFGMIIIDYRFFGAYSFIFYLFGGALLLLVLIFSQPIRGSTAWFTFFGQTFQPVEVAKITLIIFLSKYFSDHQAEIYRLKQIFISSLIVIPYLVLVLLQPDFGSLIIVLFIWLGFLLINKTRRWHILLLIILLIIVAVGSWLFILQDYQKDRILNFINPNRDPLGSGYNPLQSIIAVGSGGVFGRGLGLGTQSQLNFLPVAEKDFIFAVIAEELGFVGSFLLLVLYFFVFLRLFRALRLASSNFALFLLCGVILSLFGQMFINIAMNLGILPVTGIPLPLVSYGGSSLISSLLMLGLAQSVIARQKI
ncbi:MAG: rod shape-determining protein RodA [Patescibacteria group bacterium]